MNVNWPVPKYKPMQPPENCSHTLLLNEWNDEHNEYQFKCAHCSEWINVLTSPKE